jgi:hypothetical protein
MILFPNISSICFCSSFHLFNLLRHQHHQHDHHHHHHHHHQRDHHHHHYQHNLQSMMVQILKGIPLFDGLRRLLGDILKALSNLRVKITHLSRIILTTSAWIKFLATNPLLNDLIWTLEDDNLVGNYLQCLQCRQLLDGFGESLQNEPMHLTVCCLYPIIHYPTHNIIRYYNHQIQHISISVQYFIDKYEWFSK